MFTEGDSGITIPFDEAIKRGEWDCINNTVIYFNVETLIRNIIGSWVGEIKRITDAEFIQRYDMDLLIITNHFSTVHSSTVVVYKVDYGRFRFPSFSVVKSGKVRTPKQEELWTMRKRFLKLIPKLSYKDVRDKPPITENGAFIVTHLPVDLLHLHSSVRLIESHTGTIKGRGKFGSKLNVPSSIKLSVPLNPITYAVFGDGVLLGRSKLTKDFVKLISTSGITPITTYERMRVIVKAKLPLLNNLLSNLKL